MNAEQVLIVDGYNMIGAWPELRNMADIRLEDARDLLIEWLADYQGYSGMRVILVFDAHQVPGAGGTYRQYKVDVRYSREKETADECIERLVTDLIHRRRQVFVATSDQTEQHVIFGKGALRKPARELLNEIRESRKEMNKRMDRHRKSKERNTLDNKISKDLKALFEQWRRGK